MGSETKVFTLSEVSEHNHSKDCWVIIGGKVYDVTNFLEHHPGGGEILLSSTGKDVTDEFEDLIHSSNARETMKDMYVGEIDASTLPAKTKSAPTKKRRYNLHKSHKTLEFVIKLLQFLVPLIVLGVAVGIRFYTTSSA